jgi:opacity protein-like surface antigen
MNRNSSITASAVAALFLASAPASATDLKGSAKDAAVSETRTQNWTGVYLGAGCGIGSTTVSAEDSRGGISLDGERCGGRLGIDIQRGFLVVGAYGDYNWSNQALEIGPAVLLEQDDDWDIMGRIGFAHGNTLLYVAGGYGEYGFNVPLANNYDFDLAAWKAAIGVEHAIAKNWTLSLEYVHSWIDPDDLIAGASDVIDVNANEVWLRTNYKFNGDSFGGVLPGLN